MAVPLSLAMEPRLNQLAFEAAALPNREGTGERTLRTALAQTDCRSTLTIDQAGEIEWDVAVIGAGPTGALAARQLALRGLRTLLLDRSSFPREKVCGGCISGLGRRLLESVELDQLLEPSNAAPLHRFDLVAGRRRVSLALSAGAAISRFHFDAQLVQHAIRAGAAFVSGTTTLVRGLTGSCRFRTILLQQEDHAVRARARLVIAADGLGRTSLKRHRAFAPRVSAASRMGLGATFPAADIETGCVAMSVARDGYVGMVNVPRSGLNLAAAVDPNLVRQRGPAEAVRSILIEAGTKAPSGLETAEWRGTGLLTRQTPRSSARRLLVLGDAAGYVEPFTGEGMTWGMLSAVLAAPLIADWLNRDAAPKADLAARRTEFTRLSRDWAALHRTHIAHRQRDCRILASFLRRPAAVRAAMAVIVVAPHVAKPFIKHFWNSGKGLEAEAGIGSRTKQNAGLIFANRSEGPAPRIEKDCS
jgi:flavin-dependent dehydrogenase